MPELPARRLARALPPLLALALPNGIRYALLPNPEPAGRVSLRLLVSAGSMHENDALIEAGAPEALGAKRIAQAQQLPGFGEKTTLVIPANIPVQLLESDITRRELANKIQAQLGCEPRLRQSPNGQARPR